MAQWGSSAPKSLSNGGLTHCVRPHSSCPLAVLTGSHRPRPCKHGIYFYISHSSKQVFSLGGGRAQYNLSLLPAAPGTVWKRVLRGVHRPARLPGGRQQWIGWQPTGLKCRGAESHAWKDGERSRKRGQCASKPKAMRRSRVEPALKRLYSSA